VLLFVGSGNNALLYALPDPDLIPPVTCCLVKYGTLVGILLCVEVLLLCPFLLGLCSLVLYCLFVFFFLGRGGVGFLV
jgi:hypothetical protein